MDAGKVSIKSKATMKLTKVNLSKSGLSRKEFLFELARDFTCQELRGLQNSCGQYFRSSYSLDCFEQVLSILIGSLYKY